MQLSLTLIESDSEIRQQIMLAMQDHISSAISKARGSIVASVKNLIKNAILSQPEYGSLISGQLKYELGIPDPDKRVNSIIDIWLNNIKIELKPTKITNGGISGGFRIDAINSDFEDVLGSDNATIIDSLSGKVVPWLQWLLLDGGKILVRDYEVRMGPNNRSRTGMAIMVESNKNWRIPPEFAGTISNNWITRALENIDDELTNHIQNEIEKYI